MSWFPSSDLRRTRSPISPNPCYLGRSSHTLPACHQDQQQRGVLTSTTQHSLPIIHEPQWDTHGPHGLGLFTAPITMEQMYVVGSANVEQQTTMPFTWLSEFNFLKTSAAQSQPVRKDSWSSESCNPLSTLLPAALWNPLEPSHPSMVTYDTSPGGRSEYSTSSRPSVVSSPYAHSEIYVRPVESPPVKIESLHDPTIPPVHFVASGSGYDHSLLVKPKDLMVQSPTPIEESIKVYLGSSSSSDIGDSKPYIPRPDRRRAYSSADPLEDRRKRGYTRPDNASCSCQKCGKLFQRWYNLKAHMETHDPHRSQPHLCEYIGCEKRFVRRTDLLRHEQSVCLCAHHEITPLMVPRFM